MYMHNLNDLSGSLREGRRIGFGGYGEVYEAQLVSVNDDDNLVSCHCTLSGRGMLMSAGCRQSNSFARLDQRHLR